MNIVVLKPTHADIAYNTAAKIFADMYQKVTGNAIYTVEADDGISDLIILGSDAVNDFLMQEFLELRLGSLGIRYGTDDYCIRSHKIQNRNALILAGGRGRSTVYAVYDYFERYLNCHYFWDGDVIPHSDTIPLEGIDISESPRFEYRGLRYFAHRGLKRFQAEHWSFADWKQEIDWMMKKRLNFFMLRIGMDDVWQKAFPEDVPYPNGYKTIEGADANGYDDRSDFWTLHYRGELRSKILAYARDMDLMYPVDCGTMTHWYSRTPTEFLENKKPTFITQEIKHYTDSDTGKVFDFTKKENMDYYMHLTETMVDTYEKSSALFHTIGLGERRMFADQKKNFALKLVAYRRIAEALRQKYPYSKLMLASWDFIGWWSNDEVKNLIRELDPERTIILDYTSEGNDPHDSFINWGVVGKFPWIFGLFHAYESESELRGPYARADERLKIAADDPYCKGMILWPELSHSDPLILEYLSQNAWSPLQLTIEEITARFCKQRYGAFAEHMNTCWQALLPFIQLGDWGGYSRRTPDDENYIQYCSDWHAHQDIWPKISKFFFNGCATADLKNHLLYKLSKTKPLLCDIVTVLNTLADKSDALNETFILRDAVDMTRTVLSRCMNFLIIKAIDADGDKEVIGNIKEHYLKLMDIMGQLLSLTPDFSIYQTLKHLQATAPTNPDFEITLKRNISNAYCSQPAYELVTQVFKAEGEVVFARMMTEKTEEKAYFKHAYKDILDRFFATPLEDMQPTVTYTANEVIAKAATAVQDLSAIF